MFAKKWSIVVTSSQSYFINFFLNFSRFWYQNLAYTHWAQSRQCFMCLRTHHFHICEMCKQFWRKQGLGGKGCKMSAMWTYRVLLFGEKSQQLNIIERCCKCWICFPHYNIGLHLCFCFTPEAVRKAKEGSKRVEIDNFIGKWLAIAADREGGREQRKKTAANDPRDEADMSDNIDEWSPKSDFFHRRWYHFRL